MLLTAERAWSHAMEMKSALGAESGQLPSGSTRRQISSRIRRARDCAAHLVELLSDKGSNANFDCVLQAHVYRLTLAGSFAFQRRQWPECVRHYSGARYVYDYLVSSNALGEGDLFRDLIISDVDQGLRYAAHQVGIPRATSIDDIVTRHLPQQDDELIARVHHRDHTIDRASPLASNEPSVPYREMPKSIVWRHRAVNIEDGGIANALAIVSSAETELMDFFSNSSSANVLEKAAAYDKVLIASQDAVDASKNAIDELTADGIPQGDHRMQTLQVSRTALHYKLVGWRVGRNRVLCGNADGLNLDASHGHAENGSKQRVILLIKERSVLYEAILQSLESVKSLPGVAADESFRREIEAKTAYFRSLRCLAIARCYSQLSRPIEALGLILRAQNYVSTCTKQAHSRPASIDSGPPGPDIAEALIRQLHKFLLEMSKTLRGKVALQDILFVNSSAGERIEKDFIRHLDVFPAKDLNLNKLVDLHPKLEPVPIKPIFLDLAYNYVQYPGQAETASNTISTSKTLTEQQEDKESKKSWFGFRR